MSNGYALTETAQEELREILRFVADEGGLERALRVHEKFLETFETIATVPEAGFRRTKLTGEKLRWRAVFRFLVIYDPESEPVSVLRILHGARDLDQIFERGS